MGVIQNESGLLEEGKKSGPEREKVGVIPAKPGLKSKSKYQRGQSGVKGGVKGKKMKQLKVKINSKNTYKESGQKQGHSLADIQVADRPKPEEGDKIQTLNQKESGNI